MNGPAALSRLQMAGYGALGLPLAAAALPVYVYAPKFYASLGLSLATAGGLLLAARVADAIVDPWLGTVSDRSASPRRFIALALAPLVVGMVAMFNPPAGAPLAAWLAASVAVLTVGFSAASIAFQAWGAGLGSAAQRTSVPAVREGFGLAGVILASMAPQWFAGSVEAGMPAAVWWFAALTLACAAATFMIAPARRPGPRAGGAGAGLARALRSRRFRLLLGAFAFNGIASAIPATLFLFFVADILGAAEASGAFLALYFAAAALALPLWVRAAARLGKRRAWTAAMCLAIAAFVWAFTLSAGDTWAFAVICAASGAALGADLALPAALLADTIEDDASAGAEGAYFGVWNTVTKLNLALAAGLALPALEWAGYRSGEPATAAALPLMYCLLPCALKALAIAALARLPDH